MVDLGIALTWIAMSAVSAKGLTALARAAATDETDAELESFADTSGVAGSYTPLDSPLTLPLYRP